MTKLLEQAFHEIEKLPDETQDVIAASILADLADEQKWTMRFNATSGNQWDRMASGVLDDVAAGNTITLDGILPIHISNPEDIPISEWQKEELSRRKANFLNNPNSGIKWDDVKKKVLNNK